MELESVEKDPLRQDTENPAEALSTDSKKSGSKNSSPLVNKRTLIIAAVVIVILLILVIVLGALLGAERANRKDEESEVESNKGGPATTSEPGPTTPGTEVWWNVRLPKNIVPDHYDVALTIDLKKLEYYGSVKIKVNVTEPTNTVLVQVNKMNVTAASVGKASGGDSLDMERKFWFEKNQFYVMVMKSDLEEGQYVIKMEFKAWLTDDLGGLSRSTYMKNDGTAVTIASTQFWATDARRAFPCFDEPAMKATFTISLAHDPKLFAVSNMPIASHEIKDNLRYDHFQKTEIMSTYLVAFLVCDFASKTRTSQQGTKMTFYAPADQIDQVTYAGNVSVAVLDYYENYFKIPYPLPKADMAAIPNFAFKAMENWGLIFYREVAMLFQPGASAESNKQTVATIVAHEVAHSWFGNLVTMEWWDDLWLNEGFASFVEYYGVNAAEPDWDMLDQFIVDEMAPAFLLDGLASSHPIIQPVNHPDEIGEIFDDIPYKKGASVLRMLEEFLGRDVFLKGLTNYLNKYRFGNAQTDDLWNALEKESCVQGSCKNVKQMMDTWTLQMGYPVVHIKDIGGGKFRATQERFLFDPNANVSSKYETKFNYKWVVPFTYFTSANATLISKPMNMTSVEIDWDGTGWLKGNGGQTGFYRVNYEPKQWDQLTSQLSTDHKVFEVRDRGGLIDDAFNLARGGVVKYSVPLNLTKYISREDKYVPWKLFESNLGFIKKILPSSSPASKYLKKCLQFLAQVQYKKLGFKDVGSHLEKYTRGVILRLTCDAGEATCLNNTSEKFKDWMEDPVGNPVPANFRSLVYYYGIANGGRKEWDFAFEQFKKTAVPSERINIMYGLAGSKEPWILTRYLQYSLDPEKIRSQDTYKVIQYVANDNPIGRQLTWQFVKLNWDFILKKFGGGFRHLTRIIEGVTGGFATEFELNDLKAFIEKNPDAGSGVRALQQAVERVVANIKWREDNEQDIVKWLKEFLLTNNIPLN